MEIAQITIQYMGTDVVLCHQIGVGMALGTYFRRTSAECRCRRVLNIVYPMTIHAGWHIGVVLGEQGPAVYAITILIEDGAMTLPARQRNPLTRLGGRLDVVTTVTVYTDGGLWSPRAQSDAVDAVLVACVFIFVAGAAGRIPLQCKLAVSLDRLHWMRVAIIPMTVGTGQRPF